MDVITKTSEKVSKCAKKHEEMYENRIPFKAFYGKTVQKKVVENDSY